MSIVSALKSQEGSIRELAMLPQQQILKLAQMGQLNVSMVPIILSEKAQMAQQAANMQAMGQQMPPTVIEQALATNAQAEAQEAPAGIEALPIREDMYNEQSMAAGGIVAFDGGGAVPRFQNQGMVQGTPFSRTGIGQYIGEKISSFNEQQELADLRSRLKQKYERMASVLPGAFTEQAPGNMAKAQQMLGRIYQMSLPELRALAAQETGGAEMPADVASGAYADRKLQEAGIKYLAPDAATMPPDVASGEYADRKLREAGIKYTAPAAAPAPRVGAPAPAAPAAPKSAVPTIDELIKEQQQYGPQGQAYEELEKEVRGSAAEKKAARQQNMWMRVAEAGFGIMSGQSPYALTNIGKGMSAAMQSYAEDLKEQKKLDREDRKTLADIQQARRAEAKGDYDKAANLREKALNRMSEDERARLQRETQERVARISAANRPSPFQEYLQNPEKYAEFSKAVRPGFESADTQRDRLALDMISNELTFMKKDDPRYKELQQARQAIMKKLLTPSFGGSLEAPADINALVKKYTTK